MSPTYLFSWEGVENVEQLMKWVINLLKYGEHFTETLLQLV